MTKVLIITNYYPPESGAASNRIHHLASGLSKNEYQVEVLTPLPNYPRGEIFEGFRGKFHSKAVEDGVTVHRLWIYASNSKNKILRLIAMLSYSFSLLWFILFHAIPKVVIIQSPPLLVAFTALQALRFGKRTRILNVSDLWPIAGRELGALKEGLGYSMLERIERSNYSNADLVLGQSQEILDHVSGLFPKKQTKLYRNYPEIAAPESQLHNPSGAIKVVYAGLLGVAQGIHKLCQNLDYSNIELHLYGNGAERKAIEEFIATNPDAPVFYHGELTRQELHAELNSYDLAIIPLRNRIYGSVPSKIFEFSKLGLPLLYFGGGEGEKIITDNKLGWVAEAGNYNALNEVISSLKPEELNVDARKRIMTTAKNNFDFQAQLSDLISTLKQMFQ
ncbi:MAG: glycosyltransferase family 4 protein [Bacteroidia bacterium]|nr:glycosyltransferase family 4 protein [Bacteroidia bacterium]MBT8268050.1 glycosyltransferase family 4 protein [Bacteroidia bacterium]